MNEDYIKAQEDVVHRNAEYAKVHFCKEPDATRIRIIREMAEKFPTVLNIGCGPALPFFVKTTTASDITPVTEKYLRSGGYAGEFIVADCTQLPFANHSFDMGICSEVVEHLPCIWDVFKTFDEIDRVCKAWIVTTPNTKIPEPDHKRVLSEEDLKGMTRGMGATVEKAGIWWIVRKDGQTL